MQFKDQKSNGKSNRRVYPRFSTSDITVDYSDGENFLFSYIENISEMGIFIRSDDPMPVGTQLRLCFGPAGQAPLELDGEVVWVNLVSTDGSHINPGMGVRFSSLTADQREAVVEIVRTVAYLEGQAEN